MNSNCFEWLHPNFSNQVKKALELKNIGPHTTADEINAAQSKKLRQFTLQYLPKAVSMCKMKNNEIERVSFHHSILKTWGSGLVLSCSFRYLLEDLCTSLVITYDEEHITDYVLAKLLTKGIRTYNEINVLLQNGFPYGAIALSRILFELYYISAFIQSYGDKVALAYDKTAENLLTENKGYAWAKEADCFKDKKNISFKEIRDSCKISSFPNDELYSFFCKYAHPSAQSVINEVGAEDNSDCYFGPSLYGFEVPAINSALMLGLMINNLVSYYQSEDFQLKGYFCLEWALLLMDEYEKIASTISK